MNDENLRQLLAQVHERLKDAATISPQERTLLATVMQDIEKSLAQGQADQPPPMSWLEQRAVDFQADHPALSGSLRQLIDALGKAGI